MAVSVEHYLYQKKSSKNCGAFIVYATMISYIPLLCIISLARCSTNLPNIVMVLTDDQDVFLDAMTPLVKTKSLLAEQGTTFSNAFVNTPICCPSR